MRYKIEFKITTILQAIYLFAIILDFLLIWMFTIGVPYTYPFAITGNVLLFFFPIDFVCLILNLIFLIIDRKEYNRKQFILRIICVCMIFVFFCLVKIALDHYGHNLAGVV